jgi:hypothetical protein
LEIRNPGVWGFNIEFKKGCYDYYSGN